MVDASREVLLALFVVLSILAIWLVFRLRKLTRINADLESRLSLSEQDHYEARHDFLTQCLNRRGWDEVVRQTFEVHGETANLTTDHNTDLSLALIDLDQFKSINDRYGHGVGDLVLVEFAERLCAAFKVQASDVVARLGGEEFSILSHRPVSELAQALRGFMDSLAQNPMRVAQSVIPLGFCAGVVACNSKESIVFWMQRADKALYGAKRKGGGWVVEDLAAGAEEAEDTGIEPATPYGAHHFQ